MQNKPKKSINVRKPTTEIVKSRVESNLKNSVESKLKLMGISPAELIRLLYAQIDLQNRIPFDITLCCIPNKKTIQVMKKTDKGEDLKKISDIDALIKELNHEQ